MYLELCWILLEWGKIEMVKSPRSLLGKDGHVNRIYCNQKMFSGMLLGSRVAQELNVHFFLPGKGEKFLKENQALTKWQALCPASRTKIHETQFLFAKTQSLGKCGAHDFSAI